MQEFLTPQESQSTPRPDELRDGTDVLLHAGRDGLLSLAAARQLEQDARQAVNERQRPLALHEQIGVTGERLDHFRLWEQELAAEAIEDFALWEQEFMTANEFAQWEELTPSSAPARTASQDDVGLAA